MDNLNKISKMMRYSNYIWKYRYNNKWLGFDKFTNKLIDMQSRNINNELQFSSNNIRYSINYNNMLINKNNRYYTLKKFLRDDK